MSTAIPIVIAAIVIVIISRGIPKIPIKPSMKVDAKILGICMGMQLLGSYGTEDGGAVGLGLISNRVERFNKEKLNRNKDALKECEIIYMLDRSIYNATNYCIENSKN